MVSNSKAVFKFRTINSVNYTGIHPLALEDIVHQRPQARSKADYYLKHLFIHILVHKLASDEDDTSDIESIAPPEATSKFTGMDLQRTASPLGFENGDSSILSTFKKGDGYSPEDDGVKVGNGLAKSSGFSRHSGRFITDTLRRASFFGGTPDEANGHHDLEKVTIENPPPQKNANGDDEMQRRQSTSSFERKVNIAVLFSNVSELSYTEPKSKSQPANDRRTKARQASERPLHVLFLTLVSRWYEWF